MLSSESVDVSNDSRISQVEEGVINNETASGRGMEDGEFGVFDSSCRDSLLYEQWATTRDLSWMRLMKMRRLVKVMRSN